MIKIKLPKDVKKVIKILEKNNYQAYVVGGAVRDSILKRPVHDWDIATNAKPETVMEIFKDYKVIETGLKHGTVTVVFKSMSIEITTYRIDGNYSDNRRPDNVTFINNLAEDLSRRDFTINSMAYNPRTGLIDYFNGLIHLENKLIYCVGNGEDRFNEDSLRILRAIRLANQLDFDLDHFNVIKAAEKTKENLKNVSVERKRAELDKILSTGHFIKYSKFLTEMCPDIFTKTPLRFDSIPNLLLNVFNTGNITQNLTILIIYDILNLSSLEYLKYDNKTLKDVCDTLNVYKIIKEHWYKFVSTPEKNNHFIKEELLSKFDLDIVNMAVQIVLAENLLQINIADNITTGITDIMKNNEPFLISDLAINGNDLMKLGFKGVMIRKILEHSQAFIWDNPKSNKKEILLERAKKVLGKD